MTREMNRMKDRISQEYAKSSLGRPGIDPPYPWDTEFWEIVYEFRRGWDEEEIAELGYRRYVKERGLVG